MEESWVSTEEVHQLSPWPVSLRFEGAILLRFDIGDAVLVGYDPEIFAGELCRIAEEVFYIVDVGKEAREDGASCWVPSVDSAFLVAPLSRYKRGVKLHAAPLVSLREV